MLHEAFIPNPYKKLQKKKKKKKKRKKKLSTSEVIRSVISNWTALTSRISQTGQH
jgi:hypothetical protein